MKKINKKVYQKLLYSAYTAYLKTDSPLDKVILEEKIEKIIEIGENHELVGEKDDKLEAILKVYWNYLRESGLIEKANLEQKLLTLQNEYESNMS